MKDQTQSAIKLLEALTERAKELTCLYAIEESLREPDTEIAQACEKIIEAIPPGWQFSDSCVAKITLEGNEYRSSNFEETPWMLSADILQRDHVVGAIRIYYLREMPAADIGPFLKEEKKLIETIADRFNHFLTYKKMKHLFQEKRIANHDLTETSRGDWETVLDLIRQTDNALFLRIANKMLNHLCWSGIEEAETLRRHEKNKDTAVGNAYGDELKGHRLSRILDFSMEYTENIFRIASNHLSNDEILSRIQMWIQEDKLGALLRTVRRRLPLSEVSSNLRRYFFTTREETYNKYPLARGLKVLLIECILSNRVDYIEAAQDYVEIDDLYHLLQKVIFSTESHGKLGGKSADLFLASQIVNKTNGGVGSASPFRSPKTWYIPSDMMLEFIHYNNMDEVIEQKYKDIERVRFEYQNIIEMFQQMILPPDMINGLSMVLEDFGDKPLVVRSSSLLEDRTGFAFIDKHKTVFLGNQGTREERLKDLMSAVAEVYASNFGPTPIEYRSEHGLLEFSEQLGIMIQEVVGTRVGPYFFPTYSGVARSRSHPHQHSDVKGNDSIALIIPGLGTRAADRTGEEHPVLVLPDQPSVQPYGSLEERRHHAPRKIDVINLETNRLETLELKELLKDFAAEYPNAELVFSGHDDGNVLVTFDGLVSRSPFASQIRNLFRTLEEKFGTPVEIEFASDGKHLYILQCRRQSRGRALRPAPIPKDISKEQFIFSANRYITNGWISNITHIMYVDPAAHALLDDPKHNQSVIQAIAKLNQLLPKRQYVLMLAHPDNDKNRSRNQTDISHNHFNNAAGLLELMNIQDNPISSLSLGVHFLRDIGEPGVFYLPIFPNDEETFFNERFFRNSENILPDLLPEFAYLSDVVRVIDVPSITDGKVMQVLMNTELNEAVGLLSDPEQQIGSPDESETFEDGQPENYWRWRYRMAEQIASQLDSGQSGVAGMYLFGSTKNGTAGPASDIDMLIHFRGAESQREGLIKWLEGWSLCLDEINYLRTGYRSGGLLDFHIVTDQDIAKKTSYAVKINAVTDAARPLPMKKTEGETN